MTLDSLQRVGIGRRELVVQPPRVARAQPAEAAPDLPIQLKLLPVPGVAAVVEFGATVRTRCVPASPDGRVGQRKSPDFRGFHRGAEIRTRDLQSPRLAR
jgi:hypothetical protein